MFTAASSHAPAGWSLPSLRVGMLGGRAAVVGLDAQFGVVVLHTLRAGRA